jgi:predicted Zn finger-like uncharacterized protein
MALATKCPHCNTTFRVAHDQLKLRGGIVRCGACNEVFDGNAALVDPAPRTPVIIDLPDAVHDTAPAAAAPPAPAEGLPHEAAPDPGGDDGPHAAAAGDTADATAPAPVPEPVEEAGPAPATALEQEPDFDLDLNGDEAPTPVIAAESTAALPALHTTQPDEAFDLDFDIDVDHAGADDGVAQPDAFADVFADAVVDTSAEARHADGRREPTLDIPDEHLAAVALHDSFELDAYPHVRDDDLHSADERGHTLEAGVWRGRDDVHHISDAPDIAHSLDGDAAVPAEDQAPAMATPALQPADEAEDADRTEADDDEDDDIVTLSSAASAGAAALAPEPTAPATPVSAREPDEPGFVKRSRRKERWGKASRIAMVCATPLLLAGLAYQAVATFRNPLAAAVPALKPALVSACALAGCKVELPSQLDALSIEQGELQTLADNIFSFSTSLRNQSATAQSWPHIELILNDSADKPVLRRVFAPRDYLPPGADLASGFLPRSEQSVKLYFELSRVKASGYHIAVFYP